MSSSGLLGSHDVDVTITEYERTDDENPFLSEDKSGSTCSTAELQWLQVDIYDGLDPKDLVPVSKDTKEDVAFYKQLEEWFGVSHPS